MAGFFKGLFGGGSDDDSQYGVSRQTRQCPVCEGCGEVVKPEVADGQIYQRAVSCGSCGGSGEVTVTV